MGMKSLNLVNKGMLRDLSIGMPTNNYAYENRNIRITPLDKDTLLALSNEKGTKEVSIREYRISGDEENGYTATPTGETLSIEGTVIGSCVLNEFLVLFTHDDTADRIYRIELAEDGWNGLLLYSGDLNFSTGNPIETLAYYESLDIQKIYWVDGLNQPRFINIMDLAPVTGSDAFNFISVFSADASIEVEKQFSGQGNFTAGVIQYCFTYYNKYGQQSNIVKWTSLNYISDRDKANAADTTSNCSFKITLSNLDTKFDYVRIYAVLRTSYNTTPSAYIVGDVSPSSGEAEIIDTGIYSESVDPAMLLFIGGRQIVASTLTQKDNTLFLGDIRLKDSVVDERLETLISEMRDADSKLENDDSSRYTKFVYSTDYPDNPIKYTIPYYSATSFYPYENQLSNPSDVIKIFKGGNKYRIGIRFFTSTGASTQVYWLGDIVNTKYPRWSTNICYDRAIVSCKFSTALQAYIIEKRGTDTEYVSAELLMAEPTDSDRSVVCQGVLSPTMFRLGGRVANSPYSFASWFYRFKGGGRASNHFEKLPNTGAYTRGEPTAESGNTVGDITEISGNPSLNAEVQSTCTPYYTPLMSNEFEDSAPTKTLDKVELCAYIQRSKNKNGVRHGGIVGAKIKLYDTTVSEDPYRICDIFCDNPVSDDWRNDFSDAYNRLKQTIVNNVSELVSIVDQILPRSGYEAAWNATESYNDWRWKDRRGWFIPNDWNAGSLYHCRSGDSYNPTSDWCWTPGGSSCLHTFITTARGGAKDAYIALMSNDFFIDESIVTMDSPEITSDNSSKFNNLKFRAIGYVQATSVMSEYSIDAEQSSTGGRVVVQNDFSEPNIYTDSIMGMCAFPLWQDNKDDYNTVFWMYPWHKSGSISKFPVLDLEGNPTEEYYSELVKKSMSNLFYCYSTRFFSYDKFWNAVIGSPQFISGELGQIYSFDYNNSSYLYQSDLDEVLAFSDQLKYPLLNTANYDTSSTVDTLKTKGNIDSLIQDPIPVQFKTNPHILFSFSDTEALSDNNSSEQMTVCIPEVYQEDDDPSKDYVTDSYEGNLLWGEVGASTYTNRPLLTQNSSRAYVQSTGQGSGYIDIIDDPDQIKEILGTNTQLNQSWAVLVPAGSGDTFNLFEFNRYEIIKEAMPAPSLSAEINIPGHSLTYTVAGSPDYTYNIKIQRGNSASGPWSDLSNYDGPEKSDTYTNDSITYGYYYRIVAHTIATDTEYFKNSEDVQKVFEKLGGEISVSPTKITVNENNPLVHTVTVTSEEPWTATADSWIHLEPSSGNSSSSVQVTLDSTETSRNGSAVFKTNVTKVTATCSVSMITDPRLEVSPESLTFNAEGGSQQITIDSNQSWYVDETATMGLMAAKMSAPAPRLTRTIRLYGTNVSSGGAQWKLIDNRFSKVYYWQLSTKTLFTPVNPEVYTYKHKFIDASASGDITNYLVLGEFYRDLDGSEYGGDSPYALQNNTFIPIGEQATMTDIFSDGLFGTEGDAYFQRWDNVKTEPYGEDCVNNITDIISFMVETYRNLDGRYDSRRGLKNNLATTSQNINQINDVYLQSNNFRTGQILDNKFSLEDFPSQITWTKTKTPTEDIDSWTNITLVSTLDMDGDKGAVRALRRLNNSIISFQDKGIAEILFNTRTQMATEQGIPVELANSGKVDGKRYLNDKAGCINKWSIIETANKVYYIDSINSSISVLSTESASISNNKGFKAWMSGKNSTSIWNPESWNSFISFYDRSNDDVYFMDSTESLCYNEMLNEFTSFYDYAKVPVMVNLMDKFIAVKDGKLWEMHEGEYNSFFGTDYPFSVDYRVTPEPYSSKIFTNLTYRADMFDGDTLTGNTFDTVDVWNEYQRGSADLVFSPYDLSNTKRKFRIWRTQLPRDTKGADNKYGLNRITNPWMRMKLSKTKGLENHERMEIYNMQVSYID